MALFLGFDCGTQGLAAILLEARGDNRRIVFEHAIEFDRDFPAYRTRNGVLRGSTSLEVTAPPLMWTEALDRMMATIAREADLRHIAAISGSAQQHGSVYLRPEADILLRAMDPARPLADQLGDVFTRRSSPVWMDESTRVQCDAIDAALGGPDATARLTGSVATERFTGPQIRKFHETQPAAYAATSRIHLVSSYLASLLAGAGAPIDPGDGAGMNLMDIASLRWSPSALEATAPGLIDRLPPIRPSWSIAGTLARYWRERYGFPPARAVTWSGDNPCSLVGSGLVREGHLGISLGTSDTVFGYRATVPPPAAASHVFGSPTGGYMGLVCFKNGSLARERVRDQFGLDWSGFSRALRETPAGNRGAMMLPWFEPEITPRVAAAGMHRVGLDADDAAANVRAVVEAQMMAMAIHSEALSGRCRRIVATGGASSNREVLQVMADVFDAEVYQAAGGNAACLGAALRAFQAHELSEGRATEWEHVVAGVTDPPESSRVEPTAAHVATYRDMRGRYRAFEQRASRS